MFKTILVAVDGSKHATRALKTACGIANKFDSDLHLVYSPELDIQALAVGSGAYAVEPTDDQLTEAGQGIVDAAAKLARENGRDPASRVIGKRAAANEILEQAKAVNADLIVTGRRGMGGLSSLVLGSVSQRVSHHAPCACLTVK